MLVKFILDDVPAFRFFSEDVPEDCYSTYFEGDEIFDYLNDNLQPSDIDRINIDSDGINGTVVIVYELDENVVAGLPCFEEFVSDGYDDMPF